ncbi:MAG: ADYC domain-containing protein [Hyalangium sp.]|uniref:ADYC domain-containing protein n=1 Tax=Hyalangium sp. TaxID=2028555 RepID=UPI00389ABED6
MKRLTLSTPSLITCASLLLTTPVLAGSPSSAHAAEPAHYAQRCQSHSPDRKHGPQGTMLWGTRRTWSSQQESDERRSVLVSVDLTAPLETDSQVEALQVKDGRLVASPDSSTSLVGTVLQGTSSDGKPVEVTVCGAEPAPEDPSMVWYHIEAWNPVAQEWENPCVATGRVPDPRALAVSGVWDASGAHHDVPGRFTLACETSVITKCINWGYKPWARHDGHSLAELHQACTRMARADYCGNGRSHTHEGTTIDMYDRFGLLSPTTEASADWDPSRASFEAAWETDGATCLSHTRDGRPMETILQECPERFQAKPGDERNCAVRREGTSHETALLRNQSYGEAMRAGSPPQGR